MKAYNTPKDELHIESDTGETLVSITPEKTTIANLEGGGSGGFLFVTISGPAADYSLTKDVSTDNIINAITSGTPIYVRYVDDSNNCYGFPNITTQYDGDNVISYQFTFGDGFYYYQLLLWVNSENFTVMD